MGSALVPTEFDTLSSNERSKRMSAVRNRDTKPELIVRDILRPIGLRYRRNYAGLPGKPDFVFVSRRKAIWVHGCFWHRHADCKLARMPKGRLEFWTAKLEGNQVRDELTRKKVEDLGWRTMVVWECELGHREDVERQIRSFLTDVEID